MPNLYHFVARSPHWVARLGRRVYLGLRNFSIPAPYLIVRPIVVLMLILRFIYHFLLRVFVCEPWFKSYCTRYGRRLRTDVYLHWITGKGDILIGDDVTVDGKCVFHFASMCTAHPTLRIGNRSYIANNCRFTVGKEITIGDDCQIASEVWIFDSPGHPVDPLTRRAGEPPASEDVKPVKICNNVWIGRRCIIFPGVTVGDSSIIVAGSVVMSDVPANTMVAGNPARKIGPVPAAHANELRNQPAGSSELVRQGVP
jgi:acetyltransferase-like isoleucine patch superfamily enzyme